MEEMHICQSCAMPLTAEDQYRTNSDFSKNTDYCIYCFKDGAFTTQETLQEMIDCCVPFMVKEDASMTEEQARRILQDTLPHLKRWKQA